VCWCGSSYSVTATSRIGLAALEPTLKPATHFKPRSLT
jgi:hypothetical protein